MILFFQDLRDYSSLTEKERERKRSLNGCRLSRGEITAVGVKATFDEATKIRGGFFATSGDKFQAVRIAVLFSPLFPPVMENEGRGSF